MSTYCARLLASTAIVALSACGSNGTATQTERGSGSAGPDDIPVSERPPATQQEGMTSLAPVYWTLFAFSESADSEPTTISVESSASSRECQVALPGNQPMTMSQNSDEVVCSTEPLGPDLLNLSVSYPMRELPPRTDESRIGPGPRPPTPETVCNGTVCRTTVTSEASAFDPSPDFPHVQIDILSAHPSDEVALHFTGNGRDLSIPVALGSFDVWDAPYINVDAPAN